MTADLSPEQAQRLLAPIGEVVVNAIRVAATINDVFEVVTRDHGTFYVKLHTARWYADQPDTFFVVNRECAVHDLLRKRGMPLPYLAWGDYTREIVPRSALICGQLPGTPVPAAISRFPQEAAEIVGALGQYMRRLHRIVFSTPGLLEPAHARFCPAEGPIPPIVAWDRGALHHPEHLQREALEVLGRVAGHAPLSPQTVAETERLFDRMSAVLGPDYHPPRFTIGNCHAWHYHVARTAGRWEVLGLYDFEAASAGDSTIDLVELEITLTPGMGTFAWRTPFFAGYGRIPDLEGYKMRLLYYLLYEFTKPKSRIVPDRTWLGERWMDLVRAASWQDLTWFPRTRIVR